MVSMAEVFAFDALGTYKYFCDRQSAMTSGSSSSRLPQFPTLLITS